MKFVRHYTVQWHDTDANRCARPSKLFMYMQETGGDHVRSSLMSLDEMRDRLGLAFLLSSISVSFYAPLYAKDEIDVETWVCESKGFGCNRCFRILRNDDVIAEASSVWALMNLQTRRLVRAEDSPFQSEPEAALHLPFPRRLPPMHLDDMTMVGERKIVYSDIDYNGHMNNTHYPDVLCDFTPDICHRRVTGMMLSFVHEATLGHTLQVYRTPVTDGFLFRMMDGATVVCTEALLQFSPLVSVPNSSDCTDETVLPIKEEIL